MYEPSRSKVSLRLDLILSRAASFAFLKVFDQVTSTTRASPVIPKTLPIRVTIKFQFKSTV